MSIEATGSSGGRTRRRRALRGLAVLVTAAVMVAACGDDDSSTGGTGGSDPATTAAGGTSTSPPSSAGDEVDDADVDPDGVVRIAYDLAALGGVRLDPVESVNTADVALQWLIYGTLLRRNLEGEYEPGLAESAEIVDPSTLRVTLREGLRFSDGTPLDAEVLKASIERIIASENGRVFYAEIRQVQEMVVESDTVLTIRLAKPIAGWFLELLASNETFAMPPVPEGQLATQPVGAGPFKFESLTPERSLKLVKNPDYWDADNVKLAGVEFVHATAGQAQVNALRSGAVDYATLDPSLLSSLQGTGLEVAELPTNNSLVWFQICKTDPPFDDVRVRQALVYALDREAMNEALAGGKGEPMTGMWRSDHRLYNPDLRGAYPHDPDRARALLAEAGQENLRFDLYTTAAPTGARFTEIAQQQWAEIGVTVNLLTTSNILEDFFTNHRAPMATVQLIAVGLNKVTRNFVTGSIGNVCQYDDPTLNQLVADVQATREDSDEAVERWAPLQQFIFDEALSIFGIFLTQGAAWDPDRVGGVEISTDHAGRLILDVESAYIKAR